MGTTLTELKLVVSSEDRGATETLIQLQGGVTGVTKGAPGMGSALAAGLGVPVTPAAALMQAVSGVKDAFGTAVGKAADFGQTLTNVQAVTDATDAQMARLKARALEWGNALDTGAASAKDVVDVMFELGKAGVSVDQMSAGAAKSVIQLKNAAADANFTFADSATLSADIVNGFRAQKVTFEEVANSLVGVSNASSTGLSQLKFAYAAVGPVAAGLGVSVRDVNTALGLAANASLKGQDAGTSYKTMLLALTPATDAQKAAFDRLGITVNGTNNKFFDSQGHIKDLASISGTLHTALEGLSEQQRQVALRTMFGTDAIRMANILFAAGEKGARDMAKAIQDQGDAAATASKMQQSLKGSAETLASSVDNLAIQFGEGLNPELKEAADRLNTVASSDRAQTAMRRLGESVGFLVDKFAQGVDVLTNLDRTFNQITAIAEVNANKVRVSLGTMTQAQADAANKAMIARVTHQQAADGTATAYNNLANRCEITAQDIVSSFRRAGKEISLSQAQAFLDAGKAQQQYAAVCETTTATIEATCSTQTATIQAATAQQGTAWQQAWAMAAAASEDGGAKIQAQASDVVGALAQHYVTLQQNLVTGTGDSLSAINALYPLAQKAADAGMQNISDTIIRWTDAAAKGQAPPLETIVSQINAYLSEARQQGDSHMAALALDAQQRATQTYNAFAVILPPLGLAGTQAGASFIANLNNQVAAGYPATQTRIAELLKMHDQAKAFALMGQRNAQAYVEALNRGTAEGMYSQAQMLRTQAEALSEALGGAENAATTHMRAAADKMDAEGDRLVQKANKMAGDVFTAIVEAPKMKGGGGGGGNAPKIIDPAKVAEDLDNVRRTLTDGLARMAQDTDVGGKGINTALSNALKLTTEAAKLNLPEIPKQIDYWLKQAASGAELDGKAIHDTVVGWLRKLAASGDAHTALFARAALENLDRAATAVAEKTEKIEAKLDAATLKAQKSVVENLGKMNLSIQDQTATSGDILVSLLDGLKAATDAKLPQVVAVYQRALDQMNSATPPKLTELQAEFVKAMTALASDPNASIAAWAKQQLDALDKMLAQQKDADQKLLDEQRQKWMEADAKEREGWQKMLQAQAAAGKELTERMGAAARSWQEALMSGKGGDLAGQYKQMMELAEQAVAAGNTRLADELRAGAARLLTEGQAAGQGIYDGLIRALQAAAQAGDQMASALLQDLARVQAAAAALQPYKDAVAGANVELERLKGLEEQAKVALDAASQAVESAKARVQGLEQQYQAAAQALDDFKNAQLVGEGAASEEQFQNQQRQKQLQLDILNLKMQGANESNPALKALQAELERTRMAGEQMRLQAEVTFDPLHRELEKIGKDQKELTFEQAKAGALGAQAQMNKLNAELAASRKHLADVEAAQADAKAAYDAATEAVKAQEVEVARLNELLKQQEEALKAGGTVGAATTAVQSQTTAWQQAAMSIPLSTAQVQNAVQQNIAPLPAMVGPPMQAMQQMVTTTLGGLAPGVQAALAPLPDVFAQSLAGINPVWDRLFGADAGQPGTLLNRLWGSQEGTFWHALVAYTTQRVQTWFDIIWVAALDEMASKMTDYLRLKAGEISIGGGEIGRQIDLGIIQGIQDEQGAVYQAIVDLVKGMLDAGQAAAESASPSQASRRIIGAPLGQGVTLGVDDERPNAARAMSTLVEQTVAAVPGLTAATRAQLRGILDLAMKPGATWDATVAAMGTLQLGDSLTSRMENILRGLFSGALDQQNAWTSFFQAFGGGPAFQGPPVPLSTGGGSGGRGPLAAVGAVPPPVNTTPAGGPITVVVQIAGLTGDITNPTTWDQVAEPISQALARRGFVVNPHGGIG